MDDAVRFGLVGYGFGGRYFHAPLLASASGVELLGVVTTSPERAALATAETGKAVFDSLEALVDAGAEAVSISTPAASHAPLVEQALRLGLAVVCDKPFTMDGAQARRLVELAAELGVPLTVYQNRRWDSDFLTVRRLIAEGRLGEVTRFESRFERYRPDPGPSVSGGGALLDFGSHLVDQALTAFGPVASIHAELHINAHGLDDDVFVALRHHSGVQAHLWGSWRQGAPGPRFRVTGTEATYVVQGPMDGQEALLVAGESPATKGGEWGVEPPESWGYVASGGKREVVPSERGAWDTYYPAVAVALRSGGPLPVYPWDAVATAEVLDVARLTAAY